MELQDYLSDADMVFITAGMGGGTGTGAAAVVAQIARELGALTVAVVTKPFAFEGKRRRKHAEQGVARLRECVDTLITIPNQRLLQVATPDLSMLDAFKLADNVLVNAVRGISDIINTPGLINVDFADVKTVMSSMGHALMGIGYGSGTERALSAAKQAISSPLLEDVDIEGATGILINITAGTNVSIMEVNNACMVIQEAAHEDANIIFGAVIDETLGDEIRITVIATGFPVEEGLPVDDSAGLTTRSLASSNSPRVIGHTTPVPQRLVSPPRLTSPSIVTPKAAPTPQVTAPRTILTPPPAVVTQEAIAPQVVAPVQTVRVDVSHIQRPAHTTPQVPVVSAPVVPVIETPSEITAKPIDAALEAAALAQWTLEEQGFSHPDMSDELAELEISRSEAPGTPVFAPSTPVTQPTKTVAELVFADDTTSPSIEANNEGVEQEFEMWSSELREERAGATLAASEAPWEFDAPNPELVSNEIDRRIDEALALAGKMSQVKAETNAVAGASEQQELDMDDLDLPAFLRYGSDARQGS
jgi:cell division protein FtsZ